MPPAPAVAVPPPPRLPPGWHEEESPNTGRKSSGWGGCMGGGHHPGLGGVRGSQRPPALPHPVFGPQPGRGKADDPRTVEEASGELRVGGDLPPSTGPRPTGGDQEGMRRWAPWPVMGSRGGGGCHWQPGTPGSPGCLPATGGAGSHRCSKRPCLCVVVRPSRSRRQPLSPLPCPAGRPRSPPRRELRSGLRPVAAVPAIRQVRCSGPGWLCRGVVPSSLLQTFCTQRLEKVAAVHLQAGLRDLGSRGWGLRAAFRRSAWFPVLSPSPLLAVTPSPNPGSPLLRLAGRRQRGKSLRGWLRRGRVAVAGAAGGPLVTMSWGVRVCRGVTSPLLVLGTQGGGGRTPLLGWGGWGAP